MGKSVGLIMIVLALWVSVELYTNGFSGAFGGVFASEEAPAEEERSWAGERARAKTERGHAERAATLDRLSGTE